MFQRSVRALVRFFPLSLSMPMGIQRAVTIKGVLMVATGSLYRQGGLFHILRSHLEPPRFGRRICGHLCLLIIQLLPNHVRQVSPRQTTTIVVGVRQPIQMRLQGLMGTLSRLSSSLFVVLLSILLSSIRQHGQLSPAHQYSSGRIAYQGTFLVYIPGILSGQYLVRPFIGRSPLLITTRHEMVSPRTRQQVRVQGGRMIQVRIIFPTSSQTCGSVVGPLMA